MPLLPFSNTTTFTTYSIDIPPTPNSFATANIRQIDTANLTIGIAGTSTVQAVTVGSPSNSTSTQLYAFRASFIQAAPDQTFGRLIGARSDVWLTENTKSDQIFGLFVDGLRSARGNHSVTTAVYGAVIQGGTVTTDITATTAMGLYIQPLFGNVTRVNVGTEYGMLVLAPTLGRLIRGTVALEAPSLTGYTSDSRNAFTLSLQGLTGGSETGIRFGAEASPIFLHRFAAGVLQIVRPNFGNISVVFDLSSSTAPARIYSNNNLRLGNLASTSSTLGHIMIPGVSGVPTGIPSGSTASAVPILVDTTNQNLYFYSGSWRPVGGTGVTSIAGTANQITASASTGAVTLSIPLTFVAPGSVTVTGGNLISSAANLDLTTSTGLGVRVQNNVGATAYARFLNDAAGDMYLIATPTGSLASANLWCTGSGCMSRLLTSTSGGFQCQNNVCDTRGTTTLLQQGVQVLDTLTAGTGITITGSGNSRTISATGTTSATVSASITGGGSCGGSVSVLGSWSNMRVTLITGTGPGCSVPGDNVFQVVRGTACGSSGVPVCNISPGDDVSPPLTWSPSGSGTTRIARTPSYGSTLSVSTTYYYDIRCGCTTD